MFLPKNRTTQRSRRNHHSDSLRPGLLVAAIALLLGSLQSIALGQKPTQDYLVYVLSESADRIALLRFGPAGARIDHDLHIGAMPTDINGPHGIAVSPDKGSIT